MSVYYGTIALLTAWLILHKFRPSRSLFAGVWLAVVLLLGLSGYLVWRPSPHVQCTRIGMSVTVMSTILLTGPILILTLKTKWNILWSILIALVLPYPTMMLCVALLAVCGQMWGL